MRTVYLTSGDPVATMDSDKADAGVGSGLMLGADGKTVGFDLYCEVKPNVWVQASRLPEGLLSEERRRGTLENGIFIDGKLINRLNVNNVHDRLIAAKVGLELEAEKVKGGSTAFKAHVGEPMEQLAKQVQGLMKQLQKLHTLEEEMRRAEVEALVARAKKLRRNVRRLKDEEQEEKIKPEDVEPHPLDFLSDVTRAYTGKTLSTASLLMLAKAEQISDYVELNGSSLLLDPAKMRALRALLFE